VEENIGFSGTDTYLKEQAKHIKELEWYKSYNKKNKKKDK